MNQRVTIDGKFFAAGGARFDFKGVTYGTFRPRALDDERFPARDVMKRDFAAMREAGFTVVRTYTPPTDDLLDLAADSGLVVLAGLFYPDWRYLVGRSAGECRRAEREARRVVRAAARRYAADDRVLALALGNEVPGDVVRWFGTRRIAGAIDDLASVVREEDADRLVTYANYPTAEYLPLDCLDFLTFNVFLERREDLRRYLTRLHHLAGDRPLVLGELGLHAGPSPAEEEHQAQTLDWQLETATERGVAGTCVFSWTDEWWVGEAAVEGWNFGLTRADRSPKPALHAVARWNARTVRDLDVRWPSMSVVICAYNAEATLDECLRNSCASDYPGLEILVVDDGSTDGTAEIVARHPAARLVSIEHGGLSVARNVGFAAATGDVVAYLDSDAYPSPEWPWFLALAFDGSTVGGAGGPNVPPPHDPPGAQAVARSPGGPVHVLVTDDRAEHVPGCNMAFWKHVLTEVGGFDPIYTSAGDDVDLCWKVLDRGWLIGFHPAALVWHHRRAGLRAYLRQQRGYGRSEALVEARHPSRFTPTGTARWHGRIYDSLAPWLLTQRVYRGVFGSAAYQSVYRSGGYTLDLAHQVGVPGAALTVPTGALGLTHPLLTVPAVAAVLFLLVLAGIDMARARPPRRLGRPLRFRCSVAVMHLLQPLVRLWGRTRNRSQAWRDIASSAPLPAGITWAPGQVLLVPQDRPRAELAAAVLLALRRRGWRVVQPTGWEDYDGRAIVSGVMHADIVTSAHPEGVVQLRLRRRIRRWPATALAAVTAACLVVSLPLAAAVLLVGTVEWGRGHHRVRRVLRDLSEHAGT